MFQEVDSQEDFGVKVLDEEIERGEQDEILPDVQPTSVLMPWFISGGEGTAERCFQKLRFSSLPSDSVHKYLLSSTS